MKKRPISFSINPLKGLSLSRLDVIARRSCIIMKTSGQNFGRLLIEGQADTDISDKNTRMYQHRGRSPPPEDT